MACKPTKSYYHQSTGRPGKGLYALMGAALLLQQMYDLTDEETVGMMAISLSL